MATLFTNLPESFSDSWMREHTHDRTFTLSDDIMLGAMVPDTLGELRPITSGRGIGFLFLQGKKRLSRPLFGVFRSMKQDRRNGHYARAEILPIHFPCHDFYAQHGEDGRFFAPLAFFPHERGMEFFARNLLPFGQTREYGPRRSRGLKYPLVSIDALADSGPFAYFGRRFIVTIPFWEAVVIHPEHASGS